MNTIYKASYSAKVISSFYDNYFNNHEYELIKGITLRKTMPTDNASKKSLHFLKYFNLFILIQL